MSKTKKKSSKRNIVLASLLIILIVGIGTVFAFYKYVKSKVYIENKPTTTVTNVEKEEYTEVEGITNILLIGVDTRDLDEPSRSDSMIIATLDSNNKKIKLTSLFRDTLVDIPGHGEAKLNAAYMLGGADLLMQTIKETYNIKIDKYAVINFWGFEAIIDQIGGIEVDVKDYQLDELNKYIGESTGGNDCPVESAGVQVLNGKQALSYARIRYNVGDEFERTDRQREVLVKVAEKLKETKPSKYLGIMNKMLDYFKTNIDPMDALNMAYTIFKFPTLDTQQLQMPMVELSESTIYKDLGYVFLMDRKQNAEVLYDFIYKDKMPNKDELDYNSLATELQKYKSSESIYNQMYNINPSDYTESESTIITTPKKEPVYIEEEPIVTPQQKPTTGSSSESVTLPNNGNNNVNTEDSGNTDVSGPSIGDEVTSPQSPSQGEVDSGTTENENAGTTVPDNSVTNPTLPEEPSVKPVE